jgi:hypothetical protein
MLRAAIALAATLALGAALPRLALAEDAMCGVRGGSAFRDAALLAESVSFEASWMPAAPVFGAMSSVPVVASAAVPDADEILWCASPDDPRCAPAESGAGGSPRLGDGFMHWVVPARSPGVAASPCVSLREVAALGGPSLGVVRSLERPPR